MDDVRDLTDFFRKTLTAGHEASLREATEAIDALHSQQLVRAENGNRLWYGIRSHDAVLGLSGGLEGILNTEYPAALLFENAGSQTHFFPLMQVFARFGIHYLMVNSEGKFRCDADVLSHYYDAAHSVRIDDSFLENEAVPFDYEVYEYIRKGGKYINPERFSLRHLLL